ncbi:MAG: hypothetical protein OER88_09290, partial [Planctomycetota bacterium]|nr:hypothetical protein [Planctomycetota bacterium]
EVILKTGGSLSCEVIEETDTTVKIRLPHGVMVIPRSKIASIVREKRHKWLMREARNSEHSGSTAEAVEMFERALADAPRDESVKRELVNALAKHAQALVDQYRFREARNVLRRLGKLARRHEVLETLPPRIERAVARNEQLYDEARKAAQGGDYRRALARLEEWRVHRPLEDPMAQDALAACHTGAAYKATDQGHLRQALDHFRAAQVYGARAGVDRALYLLQPIAVLEALKEGDTAAARRLLDGIETTYPYASVPVFLRAVLSHVTGEVKLAVDGYAVAARKAADEASGRGGVDYKTVRRYATATMRAAIARPPAEGVAKWRQIFLSPLVRFESGRYFVVYAPTDKEAQRVAEAADDVYVRIAKDLMGRVPPGARAEIVIHPSRQAYIAADPTPPGAPLLNVTIDRSKTGGLCYDTLDEKGQRIIRVESYAADDLLANTLPHELVHVVQRRGLDVFRRAHWLDEGLAMLYESKAGRANRQRLWRTLKKGRIPLPELLGLRSTPPDKVSIFYTEAHSLAAFLKGLGTESDWRRFLQTLSTSDFKVALKRAYEIESVEVLERRWLAQ